MIALRRIFISILILSGSFSSAGEVKLKLFQNMSVFPIDHADTNEDTQKALDDAWWKLRELLTSDKRFYVATKKFLISREAFQPRKDLDVKESIFLAQAIDAEVLVTLSSRDQKFAFRVYWAQTGTLLWSQDYKLNVAVLEKDQIERAAVQAGRDFLDHIPFQGYQIGQIVRSNQIRATAFKGNFDVVEGDVVEWIDVIETKAGDSFFEKPTIRVLAQGKIEKVDGDQIRIVATALDNISALKDKSLIHFPKLASKSGESGPDIDARNLSQKKAETRSASNVFLSAIFTAIGMLLLAF